jgi:hypothetical protein
LQDKGRNGDTILAHINPREAALLREQGGSGEINPETGLMEFEDGLGGQDEATLDRLISERDPQGYVSGYDVPSADNPLQYSEQYTPTDFSLPASRLSEVTGAPAFDIASRAPDVGAVTPYQLAARPDFSLAKPEKPEESQKSFLDTLTGGLTGGDKARLGLGALGGLQTALTARKARQGAQQAAQQIRDIGAPYQQRGLAEQAAASRGELTPVNQQALEAQRARAAQAGVARGGVGIAQQQRAEEDLRNRLLAAQQDFGLKLSGIGDQYTAKAIQEGIRADSEISSLYGQYFGNLTRLAAPTVIQSNQPPKA